MLKIRLEEFNACANFAAENAVYWPVCQNKGVAQGMRGTVQAWIAGVIVAACGVFNSCSTASFDDSGLDTFASSTAALRFSYPRLLYKMEKHAVLGDAPQTSIALTIDSPANRAYFTGAIHAQPEPPPMITVEIYSNETALDPQDWITTNTNWIVSDKQAEIIMLDGVAGVLLYWDGLYAGKSAVVTTASHAYVFSVNWIAQDDVLVEYFEALLSSVVIDAR